MRTTSQNLIKIAEFLSDGQYHDGTSIGQQLNITRAAVWKAIKKLTTYGVPLKSIKGKGYLLETPLILLNHEKIIPHLRHKSIQLDILEKLGSTNDYLKDFTDQNRIRICIAESQNQGKGRLNRQWYSPFGQNIYFSMLYPFQKDISELSGLSLVVGLAICKAISSIVKLNDNKVSIKWPNDVLLNQCKFAGTLIEIQAESNGFCKAIIGIGINVNMMNATKKEINQPWTSLLKISELHQDRNELCAELINCLIDYLKLFSSYGMKNFMDEWKKNDALFNRSVALISEKVKHKGVCVGINEYGHLLLKSSSDKIHAFSSGDTALLK